MAKRMHNVNMSSTKGTMSFTVPVRKEIVNSGYNVFQGGYGAHGGSAKANNRRDRKAAKKECRSFEF